jgi:segregation and condensation protein B
VPGRPVIYATTPAFLAHFGLSSRRDLPGIDELRAAGLLDPVSEAQVAAGLATGLSHDGDTETPRGVATDEESA